MAEYLYKPGDIVAVRSDLEKFVKYYMDDDVQWNYVVESMLLLCGKEVTITRLSDGQYRIEEDGGAWRWTDGMFDGIPAKEKVFEAEDLSLLYGWLK